MHMYQQYGIEAQWVTCSCILYILKEKRPRFEKTVLFVHFGKC